MELTSDTHAHFGQKSCFPKSHGLESHSLLFLHCCLLGPLLTTSEESLLVVKTDFQLRLIYSSMLNGFIKLGLSPCSSGAR